MKNNQLFNGSLIFFLLLMGALIFSNLNHRIKAYKKSNYSVFFEMLNDSAVMNYAGFINLIADEQKSFKIIDLRNSVLFDTLHVEGALNIPFDKLLEKENLSFFKKNKDLKIIYADTESKSALACMMLLSSGVENIKYLPGNFDIIYNNLIINNNPSFYYYSEDKHKWDYPRQMGGEKNEKEKKTYLPEQIEIKPTVKGGC